MRSHSISKAILVCGAVFWTQAYAFDFAISNFKFVRNGTTIFDDSFTSTAPPTAPNFRSGAAASYTLPAGSISPAVGGRLHLNSATATISPAVSSKLAVAAHLNTSRDATDPATGLKSGATLEVSAIWDAVTPAGAAEAYFIEMGDWADLPAPQGKTCECIRVGVVKQTDGTVIIRFWRDTIGNDAIQTRTVLGSVPFAPGSNQQILLKLKKASATSNNVIATYTFVNGGVVGTETALLGTTDLFTARGYALAAFKASAPLAYANLQGTNRNLSMTANINVANSHVGRTGNIYVAAIYQGAIFFNNGSTWGLWTGGAFTPYASNVTLSDRSVNVLANLDVSGLIGAVILVGYGQGDQDLLNSSAYEIVHTVQ